MQEEIFAPILPVVQVDTVEEGLRYLAERPRPLSLYLFDTDAARIEDVLRRTHTGGVTINDCFLHCVAEALPFGGIGASGVGAYHGKAGFDELSHHKAVFHQARLSTRFLSMPPFGRAFERLLDFLL